MMDKYFPIFRGLSRDFWSLCRFSMCYFSLREIGGRTDKAKSVLALVYAENVELWFLGVSVWLCQ